MARLFSDVRMSTSAQVRRICSKDKGWDPGAMAPLTAHPRGPHGAAPQRERSERVSAGRGGVAHAGERPRRRDWRRRDGGATE